MAAKILVVDDNANIRELVRLHLTAAGHDVLLAEDALVAGRMLLDTAPDLLIVDVALPYMSGHEFVATLVADCTVPCIPVIFLTGDESFSARAADLNAECLLKPCDAGKLVETVGRLLKSAESDGVMATLKAPRRATA